MNDLPQDDKKEIAAKQIKRVVDWFETAYIAHHRTQHYLTRLLEELKSLRDTPETERPKNDLPPPERLDLRAEIYCLLEPEIKQELFRTHINGNGGKQDPIVLAFLVADLILENYKLERIKP